MNKMNAAQMLLDGSEEAPAKDSGGLLDFIKISQQEGALMLVNQAAMVLDVSPARVSQLCQVGKFRTWSFYGKNYLSCREIHARRTSEIKTGRPPRSVGHRVKLCAKLIAAMDAKQLVSTLVD
jgi:hypothetical protein